ncbi:MAG: thymidine kinase [Spirochaetales bacterium]|nr:thymidine kinase [Spirochaetales bacterium]
MEQETQLLKSLGFPDLRFHSAFNHFDFTRPGRRILVIGPMGSGKTEYSARVWRDSQVAQRKTGSVREMTSASGADRRKVFFIRSILDKERFPDYPSDALPYRNGYERCGQYTADIRDSFELEAVMARHPEVGTWIIDEAAFYEERLAYVVENDSRRRGTVFIFPSLILNFRREIFNATARLLLETATDIFPLSAYCEQEECLQDSLNTYRYYLVDGRECPALYFDPLIIVGGDKEKVDPREPNYCTRCDVHHYLPAKEYTYLILKPLGEQAAAGDPQPLRTELELIRSDIERSRLYLFMSERYLDGGKPQPIMMNALKVPCIAEKALSFLYAEQNLVSRQQVLELVDTLALDREYLEKRLRDNGRVL